MREYIFRGKSRYGDKWVEGSLIHQDDYCCILHTDVHPADEPYLEGETGIIDGRATPVIPESVGQYTGMKDKNGRKIFEGDIVNCITSDFDGSNKHVYNYKITDIADFEQMGFLEFCHEIEVIDNMYENVDLLEG